jgi:CRP-like cAMP-binding protein
MLIYAYQQIVHYLSSCSCAWQVIRLQEEFFLPGEIILEQGSAVDQIYFVCHGALVSSSLGITA